VRLTTGLVLWIVAAVAATAVGLAAVAAIGTDIFGAGQDPLSQSEVDQLLASRTQPPPSSPSSPSSTTTTTTTTAAPPPTVETPTVGGTVISRCTANGLVEVVTATPAQGYQLDSEDGIEDHPSVKFTNGDTKIEVRLRCVNGTPSPEIKYDD
jgi:cytoskeletal protein RodZ